MSNEIDGKLKTKPANNPWYLLATLYGEPAPNDFELQARNRRAWNRYILKNLEEHYSNTAKEVSVYADDLTPLSEEELSNINKEFLERHRQAASTAEAVIPNLRSWRAPSFSDIEFNSHFSVTGYLFAYADFSHSVFSGTANFEGAIFVGDPCFEGAAFAARANFDAAVFLRRATFNGATFSARTTFKRATFSGEVDFERATFSDIADFEGAAFSARVRFRRTYFNSLANFNGAKLSEADFERATFSGEARFANVTFSNRTYFDRATFSSGAAFASATFSEFATFAGAIFFWIGNFEDAIFSEAASFEGATFSALARFEHTNFFANAHFEGTTFSGIAQFKGAAFRSATSFVDAEISGPTSFETATFSAEPPRFFNAKLHENTVWRNVRWPIPLIGVANAGQFVDTYERLKLEMDRLKKHEDELDFFALELQSRRALHGDWTPISKLKFFGRTIPVPALKIPGLTFASGSRNLFGRRLALPLVTLRSRKVTLFRPAFGLAIWAYGMLCNYGRSYVRPLSSLLITATAGAVAFWPHFGLFHFPKAVGLSLANTLGVLGFRKDFIDPHVIETLPRMLKIVSGVQTVAGIVLLFLFVLAVRNRFRMR